MSHYTKQPYPEDFEKAWQAMPERDANNPKKLAFKAWQVRIREGVNPEDLLRAAERYRAYCKQKGIIGTDKVLMGATFFGPNERWKGFLPTQEPPVIKKVDKTEPSEERIDARPFLRELIEKLAGSKQSPTCDFVRSK